MFGQASLNCVTNAEGATRVEGEEEKETISRKTDLFRHL